MSHKGYALEHDIEKLLLDVDNKTNKDPIIKADGQGFGRSFRVPGSGAMSALKGDVISAIPWLPKQLKVECKHRFTETQKGGQLIRVEIDWIIKNNEEAARDNQLSILVIKFKGARNSTWFIMETWVEDILLSGVISKNQTKKYTELCVFENKQKTKFIVSNRDLKSLDTLYISNTFGKSLVYYSTKKFTEVLYLIKDESKKGKEKVG